MWNLNHDTNELIYKTFLRNLLPNRLTDVENKFLATKGGMKVWN